MSVLMIDPRVYCPATTPEADGVTVGGAIDFTKRFEFADDTAAPSLFDLVSSSGTDVATKIIYQGRDTSGVKQSETLTANGTTKVAGTKSLERLLAAAITGGTIAGLANPGGTAPVGDIALMAHSLTITAHTMQAGAAQATAQNPPVAKLAAADGAAVSVGMILRTTGGTGPNQIRRIAAINPNALGADFVAVDRNWTTLPDATTTYEVASGFHFELTGSNGGVAIAGTTTQVLAITRAFIDAAAQASGGGTNIYYETGFLNNNNQTLALTAATETLQAISPSLPGTAALDFALFNSLNDTTTQTNRATAPTGITSFSTGSPPQTINVPSPGNLPASTGGGNAAGAQKIVWRLTLPAGSAAYKGSPGFTQRTQGSST